MRPQLQAYLFLERLMIEADDREEDYGHELRDRIFPFWDDLNEDEKTALHSRCQSTVYERNTTNIEAAFSNPCPHPPKLSST